MAYAADLKRMFRIVTLSVAQLPSLPEVKLVLLREGLCLGLGMTKWQWTGPRRPGNVLRLFQAQSIRVQILLAFVSMSVITASLGIFSTSSLDYEGQLVDRTYDRSLMAISFARAASADFNAILAAFARNHSLLDTPPSPLEVDDLRRTMEEDLSIAVERAQSSRASQAAERALQALSAWSQAQERFDRDGRTADKAALDRQAAIVTAQLDLLINYTAGDGFTYRQKAHATVRENRRFNIAATLTALAISGAIAWLLARRIIGPMRTASHVAGQIADGDLDVAVPAGRSDELGALFSAMERMRRSIKASMEREVTMRESAQMQLASALEHSAEGVVVIDAGARIALANPQAADLLLGVTPDLQVGTDAESLVANLRALPSEDGSPSHEFECADGRWLRVSENATKDGGSVIICSDISLIKAQQTALNTANFWLDAALANLSHGLCLFGADGRLKVFNRRFCDIFALPTARVRAGMMLDDVLVESSLGRETLGRLLHGAKLKARTEPQGEQVFLLPHDRQISTAHRPLDGGGWLATFEDVTERIEAQRKIAFMARHDALTGLPNRVLFGERVELAISAARRGNSFALLCLDLDHFKQVNDTLGHPTGDDLLREVSTRIRKHLSDNDTFARLGGDEFAIIKAHLEDASDAAALAKKILEALASPFHLGSNKVGVSASIGISIAPDDGDEYDHLLKKADMALYRAKADGRNAIRFFQRGMDEALQARRLLEMDLREALAKKELRIYYQPVFSIDQPRMCGVEALVRWQHPTRGLVPPAEFIPLSEEMGLIAPIGDFVLQTACEDAMRWPSDITVAVNVSAAQFRNGDLLNKIVEALFVSGLPAERLELEITESVLLEDNRSTLVMLQQIRELGVRISLDDFGTGYSSLSYLRSFPFDRLKIDQSFTRDASAGSRAIIRTIISLCSSLGMRTTGEGVETQEQLEALMREGCDEAQGYFFSRPVSATRIASLVGSATLPSMSTGKPESELLSLVAS